MKEEVVVANQYVIFAVQDQLCAFTIDEVIEIIQIQMITELPGTKSFITGVINLRGNVIPVVDLRKRYEVSTIPFTKKSRILIVQDDTEKIGLIVDEVMMVTNVNKENVEPPQGMFTYIEKDCYKGFAKLDEEMLIGIFIIKKILYPNVNRRCENDRL